MNHDDYRCRWGHWHPVISLARGCRIHDPERLYPQVADSEGEDPAARPAVSPPTPRLHNREHDR